jgi:hypothetical protein
MRLILAKIIYNFDLQPADVAADWIMGQKNYVLWMKPDLEMYLTPVAH